MSKTFKFHLPDQMFEEFYRLFPGIGERSRFLRRVISFAIQKNKLRNSFEEHIASIAVRKGEKRDE